MYFGLMLPATYFYVLFNHEILIQIIPLYFMAFAMLSRCFLLMRVDVAKYPNFRLVLTVMNTTLTTNWHYSDIWCMLYFLLIDIIKRKIINFTIKSYDYLVLWKVAYSFGQILETNKCTYFEANRRVWTDVQFQLTFQINSWIQILKGSRQKKMRILRHRTKKGVGVQHKCHNFIYS